MIVLPEFLRETHSSRASTARTRAAAAALARLLGRAPTMRMRVSVAMIMVVIMIMRMMMAMGMLMGMRVAMLVLMVVIVVMMVQPLARARAARILAEHQRLDGHRHGVGGIADAAEVDVVEVPQHDAVDREKLALDVHLVTQDVAERLSDVAVEHDVDRLPARDAGFEGAANSRR